jgi:foldase protein PrsA
MPNDLIAYAAFNFTAGETIHTIYDESAVKDVGYWLIKVTDRQDDKIDALVMLLGSEAEAERIKAELAAGGNFSALAGNYSQHQSKTNGGKLDGLKRGQIGSPAFDQVAFNITVNEVSDPVKDESVQTIGGYWLVKVVDRAQRDLDEETKEKVIDKRFNAWFKEWTEKSTVENSLDGDKILWAIEQVLQRR